LFVMLSNFFRRIKLINTERILPSSLPRAVVNDCVTVCCVL